MLLLLWQLKLKTFNEHFSADWIFNLCSCSVTSGRSLQFIPCHFSRSLLLWYFLGLRFLRFFSQNVPDANSDFGFFFAVITSQTFWKPSPPRLKLLINRKFMVGSRVTAQIGLAHNKSPGPQQDVAFPDGRPWASCPTPDTSSLKLCLFVSAVQYKEEKSPNVSVYSSLLRLGPPALGQNSALHFTGW